MTRTLGFAEVAETEGGPGSIDGTEGKLSAAENLVIEQRVQGLGYL